MAKRTRYQYGSVEINNGVTAPDVWLYRWWEPTSDGRRTRRKLTVGTVEKYKKAAHALKAAEGMRLMINDGILRREPVLFCGILGRSETGRKCRTNHSQYSSLLPKYDLPTNPTQLGVSYLEDVRPTLVQDWPRNLVLSPKYKIHIRPLMYRLFDKAMLWELLLVERNPMDFGRSEVHQQVQENVVVFFR